MDVFAALGSFGKEGYKFNNNTYIGRLIQNMGTRVAL